MSVEFLSDKVAKRTSPYYEFDLMARSNDLKELFESAAEHVRNDHHIKLTKRAAMALDQDTGKVYTDCFMYIMEFHKIENISK
jgi:hypothetical protein